MGRRCQLGLATKLNQYQRKKIFDKSGQWIHLETFDEFDNGLSELIDLWSGTATQAVKDSALANIKEDLESAVLNWADNRAKSKKYAAIAEELAEFEEALKESSAQVAPVAVAVPAKAKKKA